MPTTIRFTKATGAGNDFVLVDAMRGDPVADPGGLARAACDRHFGVGADGLILLEPSARAEFRMRYFNADGSTGGMCGNGGRCAARLAHSLGISGSSVRFEALEHLYSAVVEEHWVRLRMKPATGLRRGIRIAAAGRSFEATFIDTGSPHAVLFTEDLESTDVPMFGRIIRHDPAFAPAGANVNFVTVHGPDAVALRTYERGVEAETLACGTGSVAAAIVASVVHGVRPPVKVHVRSGETLSVDFRREGNTIDPVELTGSAELLFEGEFRYDAEHARIRR